MALTLQSQIQQLQRKEYVEVMKETEYGWKSLASKEYKDVGCPDDLQFIKKEDLIHPTNCITNCEECWKHVLNNKWK